MTLATYCRMCDAASLCHWCDRSESGEPITAFCGDHGTCWYGRVGAPSPYHGMNLKYIVTLLSRRPFKSVFISTFKSTVRIVCDSRYRRTHLSSRHCVQSAHATLTMSTRSQCQGGPFDTPPAVGLDNFFFCLYKRETCRIFVCSCFT